MKYTVIGGNGFIGATIVGKLKSAGHDVWVPEKNDPSVFSKELGIVIYCAGHGDCVKGVLKVFDSNTKLLVDILTKSDFLKIVYISSTRLYMGGSSSEESANFLVSESDGRRLFNLTKLVSEEMLLKSDKDIIIVRPSNTYGLALKSTLFLPSIVKNAIDDGEVNMYVSPEYAKDYVSVNDVAEVIVKLSTEQSAIGNVFNIAAGENISALEISSILERETGCKINWHNNNVDEQFPVTDISKVKELFDFQPRKVLEDLVSMIDEYKSVL